LFCLFALPLLSACGNNDHHEPETKLKVGTLNMSVGFDVLSLASFFPQSQSALIEEVKRVSEEIEASLPEERIQLMAQAIVENSLDVVALQEVLEFHSDDYNIDYLASLLDELNRDSGSWEGIKQPLNYLSVELTDTEELTFTAEFGEGNAIIYKSSYVVSNDQQVVYPEAISAGPFPLLGGQFYSERGAQLLALEDSLGNRFSLVNTHLEIALWGSPQGDQLNYLLETLDELDDQPQLLLEDFNFEETESFAIIAEAGYNDAWIGSADLSQAITCCFPLGPVTTTDPGDEANQRIDLIFSTQSLQTVEVGIELDQTCQLEDSTLLWASDHALAIAGFTFTGSEPILLATQNID
jgi:endonuclease/exonuclease/phosphatase family metal-dependent hydrolase